MMKVLGEATDVALMACVRRGSEAAFEELHRRYQAKLLNFFYGLGRDSHLARDLCQETFLRIWKIRKRYRATGSFAGYLFGVARLVWRESCRERRKQWRLGQAQSFEGAFVECAESPEAGPDMLAARAEVSERIFAALEELPEEQRMVFLLRTVQGLSLGDIAEALDCPVNTVRSRKILAMRKLRTLLESTFRPRTERAIPGAD